VATPQIYQGGFPAAMSSSMFTTCAPYIAGAFKGSGAVRIGQDATGTFEHDFGFNVANQSAFNVGNSSGVGLSVAAVLRMLPIVGSFSTSSNQTIASLGTGSPSADATTFDWNLSLVYGTSASNAFLSLQGSGGSGGVGWSLGTSVQDAFAFVAFALNQTGGGDSGSGIVDGYSNATQVVTAQAYSGKAAGSSAWPLTIGCTQNNTGSGYAHGAPAQIDLVELAV
jgi:hypothetical protein